MKNIILLLFLTTSVAWSQTETKYRQSSESPDWVQYMYSESPNVFVLREKFDAFYKVNPFVKNRDTQYFKRFMKEFASQVDTDGNIQTSIENNIISVPKSPTSPWEEIGPWGYDHEQAMAFSVQSPGSAHVYTVEQSPVNPNLVVCGTATAGAWKSTDKGLTWSLQTRDLDIQEVYSVALHPTNQNEMFIAGAGIIWRSTDGGTNWSPTGNGVFQALNLWVRDLKFLSGNNLLAATNQGLYRTTDNGNNWTLVNSGEHMEIEIKPNDANTIYTVKLSGDATQFFKSTDGGATWTQQGTGWPNPPSNGEQKRCEISVSPAAPENVYVLASGEIGNDGGLYGIYKSTDAGATFTFECCGTGPVETYTVDNPNILTWAESGAESGGQYYYDLAMGASPTNPDLLFSAGINTWRSEDAGANWTLNSHWVTWVQDGAYKNRYNHADVHDIKFFDNGTSIDMWIASDGGLYYSANQGDSLEPRMHGIHGTDFWGWQAGFKDGYVMVGGTYHNGTLIRYNDIYKGGIANPDEGGWLAELGGDNYRGFVNFGNSKRGYHDGGAFNFSEVREERISGAAFDNSKACNTSYVTGEYGNYEWHPSLYNTFYSPNETKLYKTENGGTTFEEIHDFGGSKIIQVKIPWADPNTIYVTHKNGNNFLIWRTTDGGQNWMDVTPTSAETGNNQFRTKAIEVDERDPNKLWCVLMGWQNGNKVFQSNDGGNTWTNISSPEIAGENVISIVHQYGTNDGLYIGTRKRVFYKNASMQNWALFNNDLPVGLQSFMQAFYGEGKIRSAGQRSVHQCDFYEEGTPVAMISANTNELNLAGNCLADTIYFVDHSTVRSTGAIWNWTFEGGVPATSTEENPKIVYSTPGTFDVQLIVSDAFGTDTVLLQDFITVTDSYAPIAIQEDFSSETFPPVNWKLEDSEGGSWFRDNPLDDEPNGVAGFDNYWTDATGQKHYLVLPAMDLSEHELLDFSFDYTYHNNGSYTDTLALVCRTGSNTEWQTIWERGGAELSVPGTDVWFWYNDIPTIEWVNVPLDLSFLQNEGCVELAFENRGYYGNYIWVDNVNLNVTNVGLSEQELKFNVFPNPSNGIFEIQSNEVINRIEVYAVSGQKVGEFTSKTIDLSSAESGIYIVKVFGENGIGSARLVKR